MGSVLKRRNQINTFLIKPNIHDVAIHPQQKYPQPTPLVTVSNVCPDLIELTILHLIRPCKSVSSHLMWL